MFVSVQHHTNALKSIHQKMGKWVFINVRRMGLDAIHRMVLGAISHLRQVYT